MFYNRLEVKKKKVNIGYLVTLQKSGVTTDAIANRKEKLLLLLELEKATDQFTCDGANQTLHFCY